MNKQVVHDLLATRIPMSETYGILYKLINFSINGWPERRQIQAELKYYFYCRGNVRIFEGLGSS